MGAERLFDLLRDKVVVTKHTFNVAPAERLCRRLRLTPLLKRPLQLLAHHPLLRLLPQSSPRQRPQVPPLQRDLINFQPKPTQRVTARLIRSFGSICIRRSITTLGTKPMARRRLAPTCASGIPLHTVCARPKMRSVQDNLCTVRTWDRCD